MTIFNNFSCIYVFMCTAFRKPADMSSTSQKHRDFVAEPMGEKPVTDLAGIGGVLGGRLTDLGYDKVLLLHCCIVNKLCYW